MKLTRRVVIGGAALVPVAALAQAPSAAPLALTAEQIKTLEAFIDRLIPSDELGPGAVEAGAQLYIDEQLAGYLAAEKTQFAADLDTLDAYARGLHNASFAALTPQQRDQILTAMDGGRAEGFPNARAFFNRARRLTLEGMFGDPYYGGNKNGIGWDLIRYPGPRPAVGPEMQRLNEAPAPYRRSAWGVEHDEH